MKKTYLITYIWLILSPLLCAQNLLTNGDFEDKFEEWENAISDGAVGSFSIDSVNNIEGSYAMKVEITTLGENDWSIQSMHSGWASVADTEYTMTMYAKADSSTSVRAVQQLSEYEAQDFSLTTSWQKFEWTFTANEDNQQLKFHFYNDGTIYIDDIEIAENTNTYPDTNILAIDTNTRFQTMEGFGGALAFYESWVAAHPNKEELYKLLYEDLEINLLRLRNTYRYESDFSPTSVEFAEKANELSTKPIKILMSSWSPPASLKSNSNVNNGTLAKVDGEFVYQEFANYWKASLEAYADLGIEPDWISIQNEPDFLTDDWETCKFTPSETDDYPGYDTALNYVYNTINSLTNLPDIIGAEELGIGYNNFTNYTDPIKNNDYLWGYGYHLYHGGDPDSPDSYTSSFTNISTNYDDKPNMMTEYEHFDAGWFKTGWLICNNLSYGNCSGYFYWDLLWPESGLISIENPWNSSEWSSTNGYSVNPHFYAFKHFSKYIHEGYERVECTNTNEAIRSSVFINPTNDELVSILINIADNSVSTNIVPDGYSQNDIQIFQSTEGSYFQTINSLSENGELSLPSQSITTIIYASSTQQEYPDSISITPITLTLEIGESSTIEASTYPTKVTNDTIIWISSDSDIAEVNSNGLVTAISSGSTTVTATSQNNISQSCTVTVSGNSSPPTTQCDSPLNVSLPYIMNGEGSYCFSTSDNIAVINSWNMSLVTINGEDYTNIYSTSFPNKIDGYYYIEYEGAYSWSHLEMTSTKSAQTRAAVISINQPDITLYPNPFKQQTHLRINNKSTITKIQVFSISGTEVLNISPANELKVIPIGNNLKKGIYVIIIELKDKTKSFFIQKQ